MDVNMCYNNCLYTITIYEEYRYFDFILCFEIKLKAKSRLL